MNTNPERYWPLVLTSAVADRYGSSRMLAAGIVVLASGLALVPLLPGTAGLELLYLVLPRTDPVFYLFAAGLGSIALLRGGNYTWMWYADIALATAAALINLPIRVARIERQQAAAPA